MTTREKYAIADKLSAGFASSIGAAFQEQAPHTQFGIIINKMFKTGGEVTCLNTLCSFDDACHITNLVIQRLNSNVIPDIEL